MPRHILIVDAVATNRIVLKVKLASAFYDVEQARSAEDALHKVRKRPPAIIIIGSLNDIAPLELCKRLKARPDLAQSAVVLVSPVGEAKARLDALRAGADDIITKPYDDAILMARLRSLQRARDTETELKLRETTHQALGLAEADTAGFAPRGLICVVTEDRADSAAYVRKLRGLLPHRIEMRGPREFLRQAADARSTLDTPDAFLLVLSAENAKSELQILPDFRTWESTRQAGVLVITPDENRATTASALDLGANDVVTRTTGAEETALRLDRLVQRKQKADRLRNTVRDGLRAAVTDPLTNLHNRRFALPHLGRVAERGYRNRRAFAVMVADLDHFKQINDNFGHAAGDAVLTEVARRFLACVRPVDLVARIGGEEFLIVMPDVTGRVAQNAAHRLCSVIAERPFKVPDHPNPIRVTISIGVAMENPMKSGLSATDKPFVPAGIAETLPELLLQRADQALYGAKAHGRNQVELNRPAA